METVKAWSVADEKEKTTKSKRSQEMNLWTRIFHVRPHSISETRFFLICEKLSFGKRLELPLILFLF